MRAIVLEEGNYHLRSLAQPAPEPGEALIRVAYAGVNRADLLQKQGRYPLPERVPATPGMEVSGTIAACGRDVSGWTAGDAVCTLLTEGAFAEYVCVPADMLMSVPHTIDLAQAAALPEACFTAWISLVWQAALKPQETVLIHGGASGIGNMAIQIARLLGARVFATAGSEEKCKAAEQAGAEKAILHRSKDFVAIVKEATQGRGVDVIMDMVGGDYVARNFECMARGGRLCIIAFLQGSRVTLNLSPILLKHLSVMGSTLRSRPLAEKVRIAGELRQKVWPAIAGGVIKPVIDQLFSLEHAEKALLRMDQGLNVGKILLKL